MTFSAFLYLSDVLFKLSAVLVVVTTATKTQSMAQLGLKGDFH